MAEMAGVDPQIEMRFEKLAAVMRGLARDYGVDPAAVEAKAELEAQRVATAVRLDGKPLAWSLLCRRWTQATTETPGVGRYSFEYVLRADVPGEEVDEALAQVRTYWEGRGFAFDRLGGEVKMLSARPGHGGWILVAGLLDDGSLYVTISSGAIPTSTPPRGEPLS